MGKRYIWQLAGLLMLVLAITVSVSGTPLAPGYCSSNGGSTEYEYISKISYTKNPSGTGVLVVEIFISNPDDCTYGNPCPQYDNSPEYINAWIDWDGDNAWETHERVINENLTGYGDLNYYGTMTTSSIFTIPNGSVNTTWARVNLGWNHDPNDPCELSWSWGDVFDEMVSTETELPQIEDIVVTGPPGNETSPMATFPVTLEAVTSAPAGFVIDSISWTGDGIPAGATGSPYTYTPSAGTHGNKNVQCIITWEKTETGETGEDTMMKGYKLFFEKWGDEDGDGEPNWFEHWASDGAVPRLGETVYSPTLGGYGCFGCTGTSVEISPDAARQHYSSAIVLNTYFGTESFGGPTVTGIDCAAEVVAHEFYHKWVWQNWQTGGDWVGKTDSDEHSPTIDYDDNLPDDYENTVSHTWNNDTDTYDLEHKKYYFYKYYGDNEYMAMKTGSATTGDPGRDWANPGKQTSPAYDISSLDSNLTMMESGPVKANFTGNNKEKGVDGDGDGLYEYLLVSTEIEVTDGGVFNIVAVLYDSAGDDSIFAREKVKLGTGVHKIPLEFDGVSIWERGTDGPYKVSMVLTNDYDYPNEVDSQYHKTSAYDNEDFEKSGAEFTGKYTEKVVDTDDDKLYNYLIISPQVYVRTPGKYTVEGWLHDYINDTIDVKRVTREFKAGYNYVPLYFDGQAIRQHRINGPYYLMELELLDESKQIDFVYKAYRTDEYKYEFFQPKCAELTGTYESWGKDPNKNKFYDYLDIAVGLKVYEPGDYTVIGELYDEKGNNIGYASAKKTYRKPAQGYLTLEFLGKTIYKNGMDGPYNLGKVYIIGDCGLADSQEDAHLTSAYNYKMFRPMILLTGVYNDFGSNTDKDEAYENLTLCAEVLPSDRGQCILSARLVDKDGKEILWASKRDHVDQNEFQLICLDFDGRYINANMKNGPYDVKDVYVYHTADAFVPDYMPRAHETGDYKYKAFETAGVITGKVTKENGDPVPNSLVIIEGVDYDYTDSSGKYILTLMENGKYFVRVDPLTGTGLMGDSAVVYTEVGMTTVQNFVLTPEAKCGDVNCDGLIDISDVIRLLYYVGYPGKYELCNEWAGEVTGDGTTDISDVIRLLYYVGYPGQYELKCKG